MKSFLFHSNIWNVNIIWKILYKLVLGMELHWRVRRRLIQPQITYLPTNLRLILRLKDGKKKGEKNWGKLVILFFNG